jgi:hypothetical protein
VHCSGTAVVGLAPTMGLLEMREAPGWGKNSCRLEDVWDGNIEFLFKREATFPFVGGGGGVAEFGRAVREDEFTYTYYVTLRYGV